MIVPIGPGSGMDLMVRLLANEISRDHGVAAVVENRPGATQLIATEAVAAAKPDGSTVLFIANPFVSNPHLRSVRYDPLTSFKPICLLARSPQLIAVNSTSPYRTLGDLVSAAREQPGSLTLASFGPGSSTQIAFEMLKRAAGINMTFVPFPGTPPAINALLGDHVTAVFAGYAELMEHLKSGKLRALATSSSKRVDGLPEVPTVAELGYNDLEIDLWFGIVAPSGTPEQTASELAGWLTEAMQVPAIRTKLLTQAFYPVGTCGAEFAAFIRKQYDQYGSVIREAHIHAE
jgi:tripartite-type tricarboxylate transporter receptor subunit TctC